MTKKILSFLFCCAVWGLNAMDGTLDTTFGAPNGFVDYASSTRGEAVAIDTDGTIVVIAPNPSGATVQVLRFNPDGSGPIVLATDTFVASDVLIQPDGKIIVVGNSGNNFVVARYLSDGTPDPDFGAGGKVTGPAGNANAVVLQTDGRIVAAGQFDSGGTFSRTVRYESDGSSFQIFDPLPGNPDSMLQDVALQADGKIVAGGVNNDTGTFMVVRYNVDGTVDSSYGTAGIALGPIGFLNGIVIQDDGKVVAAGVRTTAGPTINFLMARFTTTGTLDPLYGTTSTGVTVGPSGSAADVVLQSDGKAVALGTILGATVWRLVRYDTAGAQDGTFTIADAPAGSPSGGAIQEDGKIVGVGRSTGNQLRLARYNDTPALVPTTITSPTTGSTLPAGVIVLSGTAQNPSNVYIFVDGVWDQTAGVATGPGAADTWTATITITTPGAHTIQAISIYEDGNVDIASEEITINITANEPPTNFRGVVSSNIFLNVKECILTMTWTASTSTDVVAYRIFRNGVLVGAVAATSPLKFTLCVPSSFCANCCTNAAFQNITIVSVNSDGMESDPVTLEIIC